MAEESAKLRIPYIAASQAQKHVTHNEAMTLLDTLVQLSVKDKDLTTPPVSPAEGDCYIVAGAGGTATGAWAGWEKRVARFIDGEWRSYLPGAGAGAGWLAWVMDEDAMYRFDGTAWALAGIEGPAGPAGPAGPTGPAGPAGASSLTICRAKTTANVNLAGGGLANGTTHDGVTLNTGDRVLVTQQTAAAENGVYIVPATGAASRDAAFDTYDEHPGVYFSVMEGTANADTLWRCTSNRGGTLGSSPIAFGQFTAGGGGGREKLAANRTYYVRADGSDSNNGLTDSAGGAFLTIQKALNVVYGTLDLGGFDVTIQVRNGTYAAASQSSPQVGAGNITLLGDTTTPGNVTISSAGTCLTVSGQATKLSVGGIKVTSSGGAGMTAMNGGLLQITGKCEFGACSTWHISAENGGTVTKTGINYTISGGAGAHMMAAGLGLVSNLGGTITLTGTP
ncbi:DUF2793 domain-containing protein, partial [Methyloceanibacter sp.]|uniref:DUF2793 domain-containing protein n=1 Tax=Methyloceanibacter sp. TaxID=1965321 RepID=UPI002D515678